MSADTKIAELLTELHQLIKQTQVNPAASSETHKHRGNYFRNFHQVLFCFVFFQEERSRSEHNLLNIQKTHERMQTENKSWSFFFFVPHSNILEDERQRRFVLTDASVSVSSASPYYRTKLRGLYTTAKADAEAECRQVTHFWLMLCFCTFAYLVQDFCFAIIKLFHNKLFLKFRLLF